MKYQVEVTEEDIKQGKRGRSECCPVALALRRVTKRDMRVGYSYFYDTALAHWGKYAFNDAMIIIPENISNAIAVFDIQGTMNPFGFEIDIPTKEEAEEHANRKNYSL